MEKQLCVAIGIIRNSEGKILIARRHDEHILDAHDRYEFIGGKVEFNEHPEATLIREVKEESGLDIKIEKLFSKIFVSYWDKTDGTRIQAILIPYECHVVGGELIAPDASQGIAELKFIHATDSQQYDFLPGDKEICEMLIHHC
jgi:8-oxo-dGTP diphosphatase